MNQPDILTALQFARLAREHPEADADAIVRLALAELDDRLAAWDLLIAECDRQLDALRRGERPS